MSKVPFLGVAAAGLIGLASGCTTASTQAPAAAESPASVGQALCRMGFSEIAMRALPSGHHVVDVTLNGKPGTFVVDTGAGATVIHAPYAASFVGQAKATAQGQAIGAGGSTALTAYPVSELTIGGTATGLRQIFSIDLASVVRALEPIAGRPVHGVIGQDVMRAQHAVVDVQQSRLYLTPLAGQAVRC
jgi:hypothetical protein